jgi:hypothetical protein
LGGALATAALLAYAIVADLSGRTLPGWTSTVVVVAAVGALQLLCLGLLGEYVGRLYTQMQGRPSYFVARDSLEDGGHPQPIVSSGLSEAALEAGLDGDLGSDLGPDLSPDLGRDLSPDLGPDLDGGLDDEALRAAGR